MSALRHVPLTIVWCLVCVVVACSSGPEIDEDFPPGNPVVEQDADTTPGDNPVVGSDGDGLGTEDSTDYTLLAILAICLIAAGLLLVRVERWERRRAEGGAGDG